MCKNAWNCIDNSNQQLANRLVVVNLLQVYKFVVFTVYSKNKYALELFVVCFKILMEGWA